MYLPRLAFKHEGEMDTQQDQETLKYSWPLVCIAEAKNENNKNKTSEETQPEVVRHICNFSIWAILKFQDSRVVKKDTIWGGAS